MRFKDISDDVLQELYVACRGTFYVCQADLRDAMCSGDDVRIAECKTKLDHSRLTFDVVLHEMDRRYMRSQVQN